MKAFSIFLFALVFLLPQDGYSQTRSTNKFYRKYKHKKDVMNISLPGWIIRLGTSIAMPHVEDKEEKAALSLAKKIRKLKLLVHEENNPVKKEDLLKLKKGLKKEAFEPLIYIKEGKTTVDFFLREKKDVIKNLVIIVQEESEFVFLSLKTRLKIDDINDIINLMEEDYDMDIPLLDEQLPATVHTDPA